MHPVATGKQVNANRQKFTADRGFDLESVDAQNEQLEIRVSIPVKNTSGASNNFTEADLISALESIFSKVTLKDGAAGTANEEDVPFNGIEFDLLRLRTLLQTGDDISYLDGLAVLHEISTGTSANIKPSAGNADVGDKWVNNAVETIVAIVRIPFTDDRAGANRRDDCPGYTQSKSMFLELERDDGFSSTSKVGAGFEQSADATFIVMADPFDGADEWHRVSRWFTDPNADKQESRSPGAGKFLAVIERTSAAAASTVGDLDVTYVEGDGAVHKLHKNLTAEQINENATRRIEPGWNDPSLLVTPLWVPPLGLDSDKWPIGRRIYTKQRSTSPDTLDLAFLYTPAADERWVEAIGKNIAPDNGGAVKLASATPIKRPTAPAAVSAVSGVRIIHPSNPAYVTQAGTIVRKVEGHADPVHVIDLPSMVKQQAQSVVDSVAPAEKAAAATHVLASLARFIPGAAAPSRKAAAQVDTAKAATIAQLISNSFHGALSAALR